MIESNTRKSSDSVGTASQSAKRLPLSGFIICFNEEDHIADCLESIAFCDERIVIDSFSSDRTVEIARSLGAKVIQQKWLGYRGQKEFGLSQTSHDWIVNIDADERISPELRDNILRILTEEAAVADGRAGSKSSGEERPVGYYVSRVVFYLGRWWRLGGWYPEYRLRFFRKSKVTWGGLEPHEKVITDGKTTRLPGEIQHFTYRNVDEQFDQLNRLSSLAAKAEFEQGARANALQLLFNPYIRFVKFYFLKRGYREGMAGLIVALAESYYTFMKYAKLWGHNFHARRKASEKTVG